MRASEKIRKIVADKKKVLLICVTVLMCAISLVTLFIYVRSFLPVTRFELSGVTEYDRAEIIGHSGIKMGDKLYDIDLLKSQTLGYFSFNGYHTQKNDGEYLVVAKISDYYVITGEVTALVLTQDFEPELIKQATVDKTAYLTTDAKAYLQPRLTKEFASFELKRFSAVEILKGQYRKA